MAEFTLPQNSVINKKAGRSFKAEAGANRVKTFKIYRYDPDSGAAPVITSAGELSRATRINSDGGTLTLGAIGGATRPLTVGGAGDTLIGGVIATTTGTLTKDGAGTLTLGALNTYSGATTISAGTLRLGSADAVPAASAVTVSAGAVFDLRGFSETPAPEAAAVLREFLLALGTPAQRIPETADAMGALFRSQRFLRQETELMILITPYLTAPTSAPGAIPLPTDDLNSRPRPLARAGFVVN